MNLRRGWSWYIGGIGGPVGVVDRYNGGKWVSLQGHNIASWWEGGISCKSITIIQKNETMFKGGSRQNLHLASYPRRWARSDTSAVPCMVVIFIFAWVLCTKQRKQRNFNLQTCLRESKTKIRIIILICKRKEKRKLEFECAILICKRKKRNENWNGFFNFHVCEVKRKTKIRNLYHVFILYCCGKTNGRLVHAPITRKWFP